MPEVIFKKFAGGILVGGGCLIAGVISFIAFGDYKLFLLSLILSAGVFIKAWLIYYRFKNHKYVTVIGTCISVSRPFLAKDKRVEIETEEENFSVYVPKDTKITVNESYTFYFAKRPEKVSGVMNQYLTSKLNTDNFLGCERKVQNQNSCDTN